MRILISLIVSLVIFVIGLVCVLSQPRFYEAKGVLQVNEDFKPDQGEIYGNVPLPPKEFAFGVLQSSAIIEQVADRLNASERKRFIAPYLNGADFSEKDIIECLKRSGTREFNLVRDANIIELAYRHPDSEIAALVVNAHMKELIDYFLKLRIDSEMKKAEDLRLWADRQKAAVENLEMELAIFEASAANASKDELGRIAKLREELNEEKRSYQKLHERMTTERVVILGGPLAVDIIEEATIPEKHISPNIPLWIVGSLVAGLLGGVISFCLIGQFRS